MSIPNSDREAVRLTVMRAIYQHTGDDQTIFAPLWDVREALGLSDEDMGSAVDYLEAERKIETIRTGTGQRTPLNAMIRYSGVVWMERLSALEDDPVVRVKAIRRALLTWLYRQKHSGDSMAPVGNMTTNDPLAMDPLPGEIARASEHLAAAGMIRGTTVDQIPGIQQAEITHKGEDCVETFDGDTSEYERRRGGATYNTYLPNAQGVIVGEQQNFTQNNTAGIDATAFVQLAGYVGQVSGTLGMPETDRAELDRAAQELHTAASSDSPQPGRLRELATQIKNRLLAAGGTMAAQAGVQMVEHAINSLT